MGPGADIDVHLLGSADPHDCLDRGHWRAGGFLPAGRYWVTADTWVSAGGAAQDGEYTLTFGFTPASSLTSWGMDASVAHDAMAAYGVAWHNGDADHFGYAITDFALHSSLERQWVVDLARGELLWNLHVAHGEATSHPTDPGSSVDFSNIHDSHQSSLGMMRAGETYTGTYGYSMKLDGLEVDFNDQVRPR